MLRLIDIDPDPSSGLTARLARWQAEVDAGASYAEQVSRARARWQSHRGAQTMQMVAELLGQMCGGGRRCCYCEDSLAQDIEHIWPKSLYPGLVFDWMNYIYACPGCNQAKGARFAIHTRTDELIEVSRPSGNSPLTPPPAGEMVFINPRRDDPLRFFMLDLRGTFRLVASEGLAGRDRARAEYTLKVLPLNDDALCWERRNEYGNYRARLIAYVRARRSEPPQDLARHRQALLRLRHPTVWHEMLRQRSKIADLDRLFTAAPETCVWHHATALTTPGAAL